MHFVESLDRGTYERELLASITRRPTFYTIGMVQALLNATGSPARKQLWMRALDAALANPATDVAAMQQIKEVLGYQASKTR